MCVIYYNYYCFTKNHYAKIRAYLAHIFPHTISYMYINDYFKHCIFVVLIKKKYKYVRATSHPSLYSIVKIFMGTLAIFIILWSCLGHVQKTKRPRRELFLSVPYSLAPGQNVVVDTCVFCIRHQSRINVPLDLSTTFFSSLK